jgi:hypothetical protein
MELGLSKSRCAGQGSSGGALPMKRNSAGEQGEKAANWTTTNALFRFVSPHLT